MNEPLPDRILCQSSLWPQYLTYLEAVCFVRPLLIISVSSECSSHGNVIMSTAQRKYNKTLQVIRF